MLNTITKKLRSNWMVLLPMASAAASFILSFWLKIILSPESYGDFAIALFTVNILLTLGVVGYDQVIIRLSQLSKRGLELDKWIIIIGILIFMLTPGLSFVFLNAFGVVNEFSLVYLFTSWMAACIAVISILFNLQGRLLESYVISGWWKVVLLLVIGLIYICTASVVRFELLILFALMTSFVWVVIFRGKLFYLIKGRVNRGSVCLLYLSSIVSLLSYQAFEGLDRFIVMTYFDKVIFGEYFFVFNFLLAPVSIFTSYYAVKRLSLYKSNFVYDEMCIDVVKVAIFSSVTTSILLILLWSFSIFGLHDITRLEPKVIIIIALLCIARSCYSILSVAYRVVARNLSLIVVAITFGVISVIVYYLCGYLFDVLHYGVVFLSLLILLYWISRIAAYFYIIRSDSLVNRF